MRTEHELRVQYADIAEDGLDAGTVRLIGTLDATYQARLAPTHFVAETRTLLQRRHANRSHRRTVFGLTLSLRGRPFVGMVAVLLAVLLVTVTVAYAATSLISVFPPEKQPTQDVVFVGNGLPPSETLRFRTIDPARAARESGLPVAYLPQAPAGLRGSTGVLLFRPSPWPVTHGVVNEQTRSVVRFRGDTHTLMIALFELAPSLAGHPVMLAGEHTIHLTNGEVAWTSTQPETLESNWLTMVVDSYVVTLYSNLPLSDIESLATSVKVAPPSGDPSMAGIPAGWPTPLPAETPIPGVDIALTGSVVRDLSSRRPRLTYFLTFGNRGTGHEQHLRLTLILPRGLAFAGHPLTQEHVIPFGSGNGGVGGDLPLVVSGENAFDDGLDVRVTWTTNGAEGERTFHMAFSPAAADVR